MIKHQVNSFILIKFEKIIIFIKDVAILILFSCHLNQLIWFSMILFKLITSNGRLISLSIIVQWTFTQQKIEQIIECRYSQ